MIIILFHFNSIIWEKLIDYMGPQNNMKLGWKRKSLFYFVSSLIAYKILWLLINLKKKFNIKRLIKRVSS